MTQTIRERRTLRRTVLWDERDPVSAAYHEQFQAPARTPIWQRVKAVIVGALSRFSAWHRQRA